MLPETQTTVRDTDSSPLAAVRELLCGQRVGEYLLGALLAEGGFGAVYRATRSCGAIVAIKVLHRELVDSDISVQRFAREVQLINRVEHPALVRILASGQLDDGRPYYAMELLEGRDLAIHLHQRGSLSAHEVLRILRPICAALSAAHRLGIVHRDVKAANIFLTNDRGPVLLDFGVAKLLSAQDELTGSQQTVGTPLFMAPEQTRGGAIDGRTDVYALGVLAFQMLTGTFPFAHRSPTVLGYLHRHARRERPSSRADVPASVDEVIVRAMRAQPDFRYESPALFADALAEALNALEDSADAPRLGPAIAVHLLVTADAAGPLDSDRVLDDIDAVMDAARQHLRDAGFLVAVEASRSLLWGRPVVADSTQPETIMADLRAALVSWRRRATPLVSAHVSIKTGEALLHGERVVGGDVLEMTTWNSRMEIKA